MRRALAITGLAIWSLIFFAPGNSNADDRIDVAGKYTVQGKPKRTVTITRHGDTFHLECFDPDCGAFGRVSGVGIMHNDLLAVSYPANAPGPYYFGNHGPGGPGGPGAWSPASVVIVYKISKDKLEGRIGMLGANFKDGIVRNETLVHEKDPAKPDAARAAFDYKVLTIPDVPGPFQNDKARKQLNETMNSLGKEGWALVGMTTENSFRQSWAGDIIFTYCRPRNPDDRRRWEYAIHAAQIEYKLDVEKWQRTLKELGDQGWQMTATTPVPKSTDLKGSHVIVFKRPVTTGK